VGRYIGPVPEDGEPDVPVTVRDRAGKGAADFEPEGIGTAVRKGVALLPPGKRRLLFLAAGLQVSLGLLDLLGILLVGVLAAVAASATKVSTIPSWLQSAFDRLGLGGLTISQLSVILAIAAVAVLVAKTGLSALISRRIFRFLANRQADLSARLAREFLRRPLLDVQRWTEPEAIYALGSGAGAATVSLLGSAVTIASEAFLFLLIGVSLLIVEPLVTIIAIVLFGIVVLGMQRYLNRQSVRNSQIITSASIHTLAAVSEALQTYRETTVLNRRELYLARYERLIGQYAGANANMAFVMEVPKYVLETAMYVGILLIAGIQLATKDIGAAAASLALFLAAGTRIVPAFGRLQGAVITIRNASVQALPTFYLADFLGLSSNPALGDSRPVPTAFELRDRIEQGYGDFKAEIHVENVSVRYLDAGEPALIDVSMSAPVGSSIALVGSTGAGKSTLADVILGVIQPDSGLVTLGGITPRSAITQWSGAISYVPQAVALVFGTIRDNVALGLPPEAVDDDLVWEALSRAHLAEFLRESREGIDTMIGERGVRLSGGQRQRLGIARALYTRPRLLVLDEATSALDAETETSIIRTLDELEGEVTTVTVAHRLATVRRADQLLYLKDGRVHAQGTFDEVRREVADFDRQASLLGL
jgi:ABC-type multidrug transport system fused ATPase/permease subunit